MKATPFEFRFRFWILVAIFALGFTAPWDRALRLDGTGPNTHVWGRLAIELSRAGVNISAAFNVILAIGIVFAFAGAALRTWATANLGPEVMRGETLRGGSVPTSQNRDVGHPGLVVSGPYRYLRNPLYVGLWLNAVALAMLMPPSGAIFTLVLLVVFQVRLMLAEEAWLGERLGAAYAEYCARVPRLLPKLRTRVAPSSHPSGAWMGHPARWGKAALAEIFLWGTAVSFAALGWQYNAHLLIQCVLVSLGLALVARGVAS
ncbi:MAG TPA: isoprenylcysteine carboxylmethyltransferase family protein [Acidobacteriaceae bacterium]|nr:isoprenylcysteine carboxylmethyltransferase family protein [Acidobacteriaceae bacterium]